MSGWLLELVSRAQGVQKSLDRVDLDLGDNILDAFVLHLDDAVERKPHGEGRDSWLRSASAAIARE